MNLDHLKTIIGELGMKDLPEGLAVLVGIVLLLFIFKAKKFFTKLLFLLIAAGVFFGAYWWHTHK